MSFIINPFIYGVTLPSTLPNQLVAYYNLNAVVTDSSGNGYTLTNTSVTWSTPKGGTNSAAYITGSTNPASATKRLIVSSCPIGTNSTSTSGWTYNAWIKWANVPTGSNAPVIFDFVTSGQREVYLQYSPVNLRYDLNIYNGTSYTALSYVTTPTTNQWYMLTITMSAYTGVFQMYIDGNYVMSGTNTNNGNVGGPVMSFGSHQSVAGFTLTGYKDEIGIWNRKLTTSEISELYNAGSGKFYPFT